MKLPTMLECNGEIIGEWFYEPLVAGDILSVDDATYRVQGRRISGRISVGQSPITIMLVKIGEVRTAKEPEVND